MNENNTWILAGGFTVAFFILATVTVCYPSEMAKTILGRVMDGEGIILMYYFGSSAGSRNKDNLLAEKKEDEKK